MTNTVTYASLPPPTTMNKNTGIPRQRGSFNFGYIFGDPFFLTTTSIALVYLS